MPGAWWAAAEAFFQRNPGLDRHLLAAALRKVIVEGPSKTARVPLLVGPSNAGKTTVLEPIYALFGDGHVFHKPKVGASCPLSGLVKGRRFILFDDYRPVEYAALPRDNPTVSVTTFLALFQGQPFDIQVSQSFHDGHPSVTWRRGAAMTAKLEGLWDPMGAVAREDIRHMQSRVLQFEAQAALEPGAFVPVPRCGASFARWLVADSAAYASRPAAAPAPSLPRRPLPLLPDAEES